MEINKSRCLAYIVKDTKTYMNVEEARFKYSRTGDKNILFILIPKQLPNNLESRMDKTINYKNWDEVVWIKSLSNCVRHKESNKNDKSDLQKFLSDIGEYFYNYMDRIKLDRVAKKYKSCEMVFSAHKNTQEHLAYALQPKELILVDSGHRIFQRLNSDGYIDYSRWHIAHSRLTRYLFWLTGMKVFDRKKTTLFTVYADEITTSHKVVKNKFDYQNHLFSSKDVGDNVVWISTPIYAMTKSVNIEDYVSYIKDYIHHLNIETDNLIYIPHPGKQSENEISFIGENLTCEIDDREIPVEFKIANYEKLPKTCISPFSSALVNIDVATEGRIKIVSAWHYEFNFFEIWADWKKDVQKNPNLNIKFIELTGCNTLFHMNRKSEKIYSNFNDWERKRKTDKLK